MPHLVIERGCEIFPQPLSTFKTKGTAITISTIPKWRENYFLPSVRQVFRRQW